MTNLARGSVILTLAILVAVFFTAEIKTEAALVIANDSKGNIQQTNNENFNTNIVESSLDNNEVDNLINAIAVNNAKNLGGRAFSATAYCLKGRTATGSSTRRGIVAADPRVLPLGTRISLNAGTYTGSYVVADTGGAIRGRKLDIWVSSCSEARRFGRRTVLVN
jgi:3D (Asp-Asp-Asp) domain-containing protein